MLINSHLVTHAHTHTHETHSGKFVNLIVRLFLYHMYDVFVHYLVNFVRLLRNISLLEELWHMWLSMFDYHIEDTYRIYFGAVILELFQMQHFFFKKIKYSECLYIYLYIFFPPNMYVYGCVCVCMCHKWSNSCWINRSEGARHCW